MYMVYITLYHIIPHYIVTYTYLYTPFTYTYIICIDKYNIFASCIFNILYYTNIYIYCVKYVYFFSSYHMYIYIYMHYPTLWLWVLRLNPHGGHSRGKSADLLRLPAAHSRPGAHLIIHTYMIYLYVYILHMYKYMQCIHKYIYTYTHPLYICTYYLTCTW